MLGSILVTIGLFLDIVGVALLLAAPRVHPSRGSRLFLGSDVEGDTRLRRTWSRLGLIGLPIVATGFTVQILGAWADELSWYVLGPLFGLVPFVFVVSFLVARQLPREN